MVLSAEKEVEAVSAQVASTTLLSRPPQHCRRLRRLLAPRLFLAETGPQERTSQREASEQRPVAQRCRGQNIQTWGLGERPVCIRS